MPFLRGSQGTVEAEVEEMKEKIDRTQHEILERGDTFQKAKRFDTALCLVFPIR